jgi:hypothetical protein
MEHGREVTETLREPADGTYLVLDRGDDWRVIVRDDAEAASSWRQQPDERWFYADSMDDGPMELHQYLKYAEAVYEIGKAIAVFVGKDD